MKRKRIISLISCVLSVSFMISGCGKEKTIVIDTNIEEESSSSIELNGEEVKFVEEDNIDIKG